MNETGKLPAAVIQWMSRTAIAIGIYYLVFDLMPTIYSGWIGWRYLQGSHDKLGLMTVSVLYLSLFLLITGGWMLGRGNYTGVTLLRCFSWMWIGCTVVLTLGRIVEAIRDSWGLDYFHQRFTLVTGIVNSLAFGLLYSIATLMIFRRQEILDLFRQKRGAFEPLMKDTH